MAWSKQKRAEYMKNYRIENREQINANRRYYYQRHKETAKAKSREWYEKNKDSPKLKEKRKENTREWQKNNRDRRNEYQREYRRRREKNDSTGTCRKSKCDPKASVSTCKETRQIANRCRD